ncbi:MAG: DUF2855 family protein [Pseudomonadota bacterium]
MPNAVFTQVKSITDQQVQPLPTPALEPGQARMAIQQFALTANNVTYAATGFDIGYWKFFPTGQDGAGLVPVWGFAEVVESQSDAAPLGQRYYGFWPMAEQVVITPAATSGKSIVDASAHRKDLPAVYNHYIPAGAASPKDAYQALLQPLIATSWLIADWLGDNSTFGAEQVIIGSASSKTGLGTCAFLKGSTKVIGLTSSGNVEFTKNLGYCDEVLTYDQIEDIPQAPSVYVDMAGNAAVKRRIHAHLGDTLKHSSAVGLSHWDQFEPPKDLAGPKPQFFFAPAQIAKRREDWGPGAVEKKIAEATQQIAMDAGRWLKIEEHNGLTAAMDAYAQLANGKSDPSVGHVVNL